MSVQTPSETLEKTSENAYGTLEIAEIPDPEYNIRTTPRLLITSTIKSASSPLTTGSASVAVAFTRSAFPSVSLFLPEFFSFPAIRSVVISLFVDIVLSADIIFIRSFLFAYFTVGKSITCFFILQIIIFYNSIDIFYFWS